MVRMCICKQIYIYIKLLEIIITCAIITEDNNTRVLFERVLSSGSLEPEKSVYVYNISHLS